MNLILEVVSPNASDLGPGRRKAFGVEGGRIGRAPDSDWVLPNPYVSRHHATVRCIGGTFYIEPTGENGVAVGAPDAMLPPSERYRLNHGDRLYIDEYEVSVILSSAQAGLEPLGGRSVGAVGGILDDPFAEPAPRAPAADPFAPSQEDLDPLAQLTGRHPIPQRAKDLVNDPQWNHSSGLADHFTPPAVPSGGIPDDWDKTSFGRTKYNLPAGGAPAGSAPPAGGIPDDWDKTSFGLKKPAAAPPPPLQPATPPPQFQRVQTTPPRQPQQPPRAPPAQHASQPRAPTPPPAPARSPSASGTYAAPRAPVHAPQQYAPQQYAAQAPSAGAFDVDAFLRNAGVDPSVVPPETAAALGQVLRTVVQGVIEVLQARSEIKSQFRLPVTRVKSTENNPLKFSVNAEDAMNSLLGRRNPAYMNPIGAFEDAFEDIRFHQLAMLAGMRAGFDSLLERFDPNSLQENFDRQAKRGGLLSLAAKMKYWEIYAEWFAELAADREETFRRLFGEEFARAYEDQLERLKRSRNSPRRS
jgi:type VI secretion system FHA domain protein